MAAVAARRVRGSSGPVSREAALWAAVLRRGRGAMLSHQSAAELAGLIDRPGEALHVTVPASRRVRCAWSEVSGPNTGMLTIRDTG